MYVLLWRRRSLTSRKLTDCLEILLRFLQLRDRAYASGDWCICLFLLSVALAPKSWIIFRIFDCQNLDSEFWPSKVLNSGFWPSKFLNSGFWPSKSWIQDFSSPKPWIQDFGSPKSWIQDFCFPKYWIHDFSIPKSWFQDFSTLILLYNSMKITLLVAVPNWSSFHTIGHFWYIKIYFDSDAYRTQTKEMHKHSH